MDNLKLSTYYFEIHYSQSLKHYDFTVLDYNKNVIHHYHYPNLNQITKLIHHYKNQ